MNVKGIKFYLSILFICFSILILNPLTVFAGTDPDNLSEEQDKTAQKLYAYMIANGYSAQAAAAVCANADVESGFSSEYNSGNRSYYGYFQVNESKYHVWTNLKNWASENSLDYNDITVQFRFLEATSLTDWSAYVSYPSVSEFKTCGDEILASEAFFAGFERCVGGTYSLTKANLASGYGPYKYQGGESRTSWASKFVTKYAGVEPSSPSDNSGDGGSTDENSTEEKEPSDGAVFGTAALVGCSYTESQLASYVALAEVPVSEAYASSLTTNELYTLNNWKNTVDSDLKETVLITWMRRIVTWLGIAFTLWMIFLYVAYWFDRVNVFFEFSLLEAVSIGRLRISPEEDKCTWQFSELIKAKSSAPMTVNNRAMLEIVIIGCMFGGLIISGVLFKVVRIIVICILKMLNLVN